MLEKGGGNCYSTATNGNIVLGQSINGRLVLRRVEVEYRVRQFEGYGCLPKPYLDWTVLGHFE